MLSAVLSVIGAGSSRHGSFAVAGALEWCGGGVT